jgi:hypothetical protein
MRNANASTIIAGYYHRKAIGSQYGNGLS